MVRLHIDVADNDLHELKKKLEIEVSNLRIDRKNLAELKVKSKEQEAITAQAVAMNSDLERKLYERKSTYHTEAAVLEMTLQAIPEDVRILSVLQERISEAEQKKIELDHAWERVQKIREETAERLTAAVSAKLHAEKSLDEVSEKRNSAEIRFREVLKNSDFHTEQAYREAKMTDAARLSMKESITSFKRQHHAVREAVVELQVMLKGKEYVDLQQLATNVEALKKDYEAALTAYNASSEFERTALGLKEKLVQSSSQVMELERTYGKITDLYDIVRGQNRLKLSFERYIQIEYLGANHPVRERTVKRDVEWPIRFDAQRPARSAR